MSRLLLRAPAKLNLGLRVVGRRADGYHLLDSVMHAIELHDELALADHRDGPALAVEGGAGRGLAVPDDAGNLVLRAARAWADASGAPAPVQFTLRKRIPAGAGLGGGSSDAAAALLLLEHRFADRALGAARLLEVAAGLGADVPFFLAAGSQRAQGIGERLTPLPPPPQPLHFLLLCPPFGTATASVFRNYAAELTHAPPSDSVVPVNPGPSKGLWSETATTAGPWPNDLMAPAAQLYPELARIAGAAAALGFADVSLSGSGSTLFLAFADDARVELARRRLGGLGAEGVSLLATRSATARTARRVPWVEGQE